MKRVRSPSNSSLNPQELKRSKLDVPQLEPHEPPSPTTNNAPPRPQRVRRRLERFDASQNIFFRQPSEPTVPSNNMNENDVQNINIPQLPVLDMRNFPNVALPNFSNMSNTALLPTTSSSIPSPSNASKAPKKRGRRRKKNENESTLDITTRGL